MKPIDMLMAIGVAVIWGMGFVVAKSAMGHFPPIFLMALRFTVAAGCLLCFFPPPPMAMLRRIFWVSLVGATVQYGLTFTGLGGLDVSTAAIIVQLEVPFALLLAWLVFGDSLGVRQFVGIALAFAGIAYLAGEPRLSGSVFHLALMVGGAFAWALGQIMVKRLGVVGGFVLITWMAALATPQLFLASWLFESGQITALANASPAIWGAVAYLGLVMTALAYAMWYHLLGRYPLSRVMPFLLLLPLASIAGGVLFLGENLSLDMAIGGACTLTGMAIIYYRSDPAVAKKSTP